MSTDSPEVRVIPGTGCVAVRDGPPRQDWSNELRAIVIRPAWRVYTLEQARAMGLHIQEEG